MEIIHSPTNRHELRKRHLIHESEHSIILAENSLLNPSGLGADRGNLSGVDERPTMSQELIHNVVCASPFAIGEDISDPHPNEIISSGHGHDSQQEDIEDSAPLIPVIIIPTRFPQLPPDHEKYCQWGGGE